MTKIQLIAIVGSTVLLVLIVELVRRRRLAEGHSILWLLTGIALLILSFWRGVLEFTASLLGIYFPPMVLMVAGLGFFVIILLHFSTLISKQMQENKQTAQRLALLQFELEQLKGGPAQEAVPQSGSNEEAMQGDEEQGSKG